MTEKRWTILELLQWTEEHFRSHGIDTPKREELIASTHSVDEIAEYIDADSIGYLSQDGLLAAVEEDRDRYCSACFSGNYPIEIPAEGRDQLKLFEKVRD